MKHVVLKAMGITFFSVLLLIINSCNKDVKGLGGVSVLYDTIIFENDSLEKEIEITSDSEWLMDIADGWCTSSLISSAGSDTVILKVEYYTGSSDRSTAISITSEGETVTITIIQKGKLRFYDIPPDTTDMRNITCIDLSKEMGLGWNVGNSLEAIGGEQAWGNPLITKTLIDSVKVAGFNSIRIPVAWSKFSDASTYTIKTSWLERVEEVVNYVLDNDMYAIINNHWDGGWMQPTYAARAEVTRRLETIWTQVAIHFRDYGDHLLFAGSNEVMVNGDYGTPTKEYYTVQNGYNQTFVTTVRLTGGRNVYRHLVVQGFNTNIDYTYLYAIMPTDSVENRLFMEVHYYDPYNFTLNESSTITQWGRIATDGTKVESWANETYMDVQFNKMKIKFIDNGIAVILGEYGVISRTDVADQEKYRTYYNGYATQSMKKYGLVPFYWDNGYTGNHGLGLFNRYTGAQVYPDIIKAITTD